jgi:hypothetical protein
LTFIVELLASESLLGALSCPSAEDAELPTSIARTKTKGTLFHRLVFITVVSICISPSTAFISNISNVAHFVDYVPGNIGHIIASE